MHMKMKHVVILTALSFAVAFLAVACHPKPDGITYITESGLKAPGPEGTGDPLTGTRPVPPVVTNPPVETSPRPRETNVVGPGNTVPVDPPIVNNPLPPPPIVTNRPTNPPVVEIPPAPRPPSGEYVRDMEKFRAQTVYFEFDLSAVKAEEKPKIEAVANYLKANPLAKLEIEGHADERGTDQYNLSLSERRALAIREELAALGITPDRVITLPLGESNPAVNGHNEEAWAKSRRGVFVLMSPKE